MISFNLSKRNRLFYFAVLFINLTTSAFSADNTLRGLIIDIETNKPVPLVTVELIEKNKLTISSDSGYFTFNNLTDGNYTLKFLHISYKEKLYKINFSVNTNKLIIFYLEPNSIEISTVTITESDEVKSYDDLLELSNSLRGKELLKELGFTLASTLKNETGLSMRSMGSAPSRPVIRGLGSDRIIITEDGNKTTDLSATSPDHAVTVEPFSSSKIEIIRGPKLLTRTSTSIGGLINVVKNEIPIQIHDEIFGESGFYAESVNKSFLSSVQTEIPFSPFTTRFEFSKNNSLDINTPEGKLKNTYSNNLNMSGGISFFRNSDLIGFSARQYSLEYGIPGGFIGAHPYGANIKLFRQQANFLTQFKLDNFFFDEINLNYSFAKYRHKEFEHSGRIGSEFKIINNLGHIEFKHAKRGILSEGIFGINIENRNFDIGGFVFTSPSTSFNISVYGYESMNLKNLIVENAFRISFDRTSPDEKKSSKIGFIRKRNFFNYSASLAFIYPLTNIVHIGMNLSKSSRVPTIEELFSEGPHLAAYSYEIGNPDLKSESGWSSEIFIYHKFTKLYYNFNFFYYSFSNYILPRNSGKINYSIFLPIYVTQGVQARFYGFEYQFDWNFIDNFFVNNSFSYTIGELTETNKSLPQIPPAKGISSLEYRSDNFIGGIKSEYAFSQNKVDLFEMKTDGYLIFSTFIQYTFEYFRQINTLNIQVENLTNKIYRNHLSRIKSILPEPGFNIRLVYKLFFHL